MTEKYSQVLRQMKKEQWTINTYFDIFNDNGISVPRMCLMGFLGFQKAVSNGIFQEFDSIDNKYQAVMLGVEKIVNDIDNRKGIIIEEKLIEINDNDNLKFEQILDQGVKYLESIGE